jgi:hypothetical protein
VRGGEGECRALCSFDAFYGGGFRDIFFSCCYVWKLGSVFTGRFGAGRRFVGCCLYM